MSNDRAERAGYGVAEVFDRSYYLLFRHAMGPEMRRFFKNLSWSFLGGGIASFVMLTLNVEAGRTIGPEGYGKYNVILTLSQLLMLPLLCGLDQAGVRQLAMSKTQAERAAIISSAIRFLAATSALLSLLFLFSFRYLLSRFSLNESLLFLGLAMAVVMSFRTLLDGFIRALGLFRYQFFSRICEVAVSVLVFGLVFFVIHRPSAEGYLLSLVSGSLVIVLIIVVRLLRYRSAFDRFALKVQLSYGKVLLLGSVLGTIFNSLDVLIIARYLNVSQVGLYGAYYTASTNLVAQLAQMFINAFFPFVSQSPNKREIFVKLSRLCLLGFLPMAAVLSSVVWVIVSLFGSQYGIRAEYVIGFGTLSAMQVIVTIFGSLITAISKELYKRYLLRLNILSLVHIGFYALMIVGGLTSISAILTLMLLNLMVLITIQYRIIKAECATEGNNLAAV